MSIRIIGAILAGGRGSRLGFEPKGLFKDSEGKTILVDTGLGDHLTDKQHQNFGLVREDGGLIQELARLGIMPEEINIIINPHLHVDHSGGNTTRRDEDGQAIPTFPNAEYWVQRLEWADAAPTAQQEAIKEAVFCRIIS